MSKEQEKLLSNYTEICLAHYHTKKAIGKSLRKNEFSYITNLVEDYEKHYGAFPEPEYSL
jgi:hypothetical protein